MKKSWFQHTQLTTEQADELEASYKAKQIKTERSLDTLSPRTNKANIAMKPAIYMAK